LAEHDAAAKLKARLNQWQEYVGEVQERPTGSVWPPSPLEDADPAPASPALEQPADATHAVVASSKRAPDLAPPVSPPVPSLGASDGENPIAASCAPAEPVAAPRVEYPLPAPVDPRQETARKGSGTAADPLVVEVIDTTGADNAYDSLLGAAPASPREPFQHAAAHGNGHRARNGVKAGSDPGTKRISKDAEYRMHAQRQVDHARRVNAILSVCVILLIALISCLVTFILDR